MQCKKRYDNIVVYYLSHTHMSWEAENISADNVIKLRDHFEWADEVALEVVEESSKVRYWIMWWLDEQFMSPDQLWNHVNTKRLEIANINIPPVVENKNVIPLHASVNTNNKAA